MSEYHTIDRAIFDNNGEWVEGDMYGSGYFIKDNNLYVNVLTGKGNSETVYVCTFEEFYSRRNLILHKWFFNDFKQDKRVVDLEREIDLINQEVTSICKSMSRDFYDGKIELCDSPRGIISQIDNMVAGLRHKDRYTINLPDQLTTNPKYEEWMKHWIVAERQEDLDLNVYYCYYPDNQCFFVSLNPLEAIESFSKYPYVA